MIALKPKPQTATCSQCRFYDRGTCITKATAEWGKDSRVLPTRPACFLAE
ncbi:MAG: hypothetical protein KME43_11305 [Myxacorys chilensis ATA2-1-KO14]|nr:hypothetical protein [Myxacorys chilensis ATA2-1-KO14]